MPLLDDDTTVLQVEPSPLIAALTEAVAGAWPKTGWIDWAAFAAAARRHGALPDVSSHHELVEALTAELGAHAPPPQPGPRQRPGWSATALFGAVNDHHTAVAPFPTSWWWCHKPLRPALRALTDLVDVMPDQVSAVLGRLQLTAADLDQLTVLAAEPLRLHAWFSADDASGQRR